MAPSPTKSGPGWTPWSADRQRPVTGVVLDTGALIALERNDRRMVAMVGRLREREVEFVVPAGCVAQCWRRPSRQVRLARFLRDPAVGIRSLDGRDARAVGELLALSGTSDVVDAHVAVCAIRAGATVLTSDGDDIATLAPGVRVVEV